ATIFAFDYGDLHGAYGVTDGGLDANDTGNTVDASTDSPGSSSCPGDMKEVKGEWCPQVEQKCLRWLDVDQRPEANSGIGPLRCAEFAPSKCISKNRKKMSFCMDTYEAPNREGAMPIVTIDWYDAKRACESEGKRLCTREEWTFSCEGPDARPYPYGDGLHRNASMCNIDQPSMDPSLPRSEWPKHNRSVASGAMPDCVSVFGVHDLTGNVDEWVNNTAGSMTKAPFRSGLQGGYWGPVRTRCRPMTDVHGPTHSFYQEGYRCCKSHAE
nr:SUMF1/EgtB/PvdO family nonheme iron enzyme [Candidatus Sigynarchaeota archaeon]